MRFVSTRGLAPAVCFAQALEQGLATDGGLFVPEELAPPGSQPLPALPGLANLHESARLVLAPFLSGDPLERELPRICRDAFSFPVPLTSADDVSFLELFHGPTAAFKDVGARFLGQCLAASGSGTEPRSVLVATSGDTGGAVAAALHGLPGVEAILLFPQGGVSPLQEKQLTCWGGNVRAFRVRGTFDDCQALLKAALNQAGETRAGETLGGRKLTTANSINVARLLAQTVYYAAASVDHSRAHGAPADFLVPSGNLGNATAALWARRQGYPIGRVILATNANRTLPDYLASGDWKPRPSVRTLANAMDVGSPSNMERLFHLYPDADELRADVAAVSVSDDEIERAILAARDRWGRVLDPHTATAVHALFETEEGRALTSPVIVATAHPAKFPEVVEPLIGAALEVPEALRWIQDRETHCEEIEATLDALAARLA